MLVELLDMFFPVRGDRASGIGQLYVRVARHSELE